MATIEFYDSVELAGIISNTKSIGYCTTEIGQDIKKMEVMLAMLDYSGTITIDHNEFELIGKYR